MTVPWGREKIRRGIIRPPTYYQSAPSFAIGMTGMRMGGSLPSIVTKKRGLRAPKRSELRLVVRWRACWAKWWFIRDDRSLGVAACEVFSVLIDECLVRLQELDFLFRQVCHT